ncbi:hypothetical protein QR98_0086440 [Sarcoptes scabiei]|uniref:Uncharacterized protein n=1 Tax=Sarcoptes scabiei TaxID=52283 RepID=A0A132AHQ3_SARSC|nr:hypothetical protein QR98_0086440 [Sarcoptes scabiei]
MNTEAIESIQSSTVVLEIDGGGGGGDGQSRTPNLSPPQSPKKTKSISKRKRRSTPPLPVELIRPPIDHQNFDDNLNEKKTKLIH